MLISGSSKITTVSRNMSSTKYGDFGNDGKLKFWSVRNTVSLYKRL